MYATNIGCNILKKNLEVAIKMGHVEDRGARYQKKFTLSEKGARMYSGWKEYEEFSKELEKKLGLV